MLGSAEIVRFDAGVSPATPQQDEVAAQDRGREPIAEGGAGVPGERFGVRFSLRRGSRVVVLLVGAGGRIALLEPSSPDTPLRRFEAGGDVVLPEGYEAWPVPPRGSRVVLAVFGEHCPATADLITEARDAVVSSGADPAQNSYAVLRALSEQEAEGVVLPLSGPSTPL